MTVIEAVAIESSAIFAIFGISLCIWTIHQTRTKRLMNCSIREIFSPWLCTRRSSLFFHPPNRIVINVVRVVSAPCPPPMQITIMDHHCVRAGEGRNLVDGIEVGRCFEMEIFNDCGQRCLEESSSGRWYESCVEKWKSELQRKRQGSRGATWNRLMLGIIWNRLMLRKKINVSNILYV